MPPPPPPPPRRTTPADYHFHGFNLSNASAWTSVASRFGDTQQYYSLVHDFNALLAFGAVKRVPAITLTPSPTISYPAADDTQILTLSFGDPRAPAAIITGGIHARECVGPEMAYLLAEYLVLNYPDPYVARPSKYQRRIKDLVDNRWIHITPMLNPSGVQKTAVSDVPMDRQIRKNLRPLPTNADDWKAALTTAYLPNPPFRKVETFTPGTPGVVADLCRYTVPAYDHAQWTSRKAPQVVQQVLGNGTGVDLNRNFPTTAWGYDGAPDGHSNADPAKETYFGPRQSSETETRIFAARLRGVNVQTAIDYHSYSKAILYPTEAFDRGAVTKSYQELGGALRALTDNEYTLGCGRDELEYDATGTLMDHLAQTYQARAFVIELDPGPAPPGMLKPQRDLRFLLDEDQIQRVFETNIRPALALIDAAAGTKTGAELIKDYKKWKVAGKGNQLPG